MKKFLFTFIALISIIGITDKIEAKEIKHTLNLENITEYSLESNLFNVYKLTQTTTADTESEKVNYDTDVFGYLDTVKCGNVEVPAPVPSIIRTIVNIIKVATPLVLIIMGMIDMLKAVIASDENKIKEAQSKFIKRLTPAAIIFLVVTIVQFLVNIVADDKASVVNCISCMISDADSCIMVNKPEPPKPTDKPNNNTDTDTNTDNITSSKNITFSYEYFEENVDIPYALYTPSSAKTNTSTPLIIWLHGINEIGVSENEFRQHGLPYTLDNWSLYGFNAYVLCPKLPNGNSYNMGGTRQKIYNVIDEIIEDKKINTNKIILAGHSYGTVGLVSVANDKPNFFSSLVVLSGYYGGDMSHLTSIPTRGYVGKYDDSNSISYMKVIFAKTFGEDKLFWTDTAHGGVPYAAFNLDENNDNKSDLVEWMLEQSK